MHEKGDRTERITITLSKREKDTIKRIAQGCNMTMSKFIRVVITDAIFKNFKMEG